MFAPLLDSVVFHAFYTAALAKKTGLTPTVDVWQNGTKIITAASAVEVGDGLYSYTLSALHTDIAGEYCAIFMSTDGTVDMKDIVVRWFVGQSWIQNLVGLHNLTNSW